MTGGDKSVYVCKGGSRGVAHDAKTASRTFEGVAQAMAEQWGGLDLEDENG